MAIMSGLQWYLKNDSIFPFLFFVLYFFISFPNVQFIPQFINVIATNNDLLTDKLNGIYFTPKLWQYVMIWLLPTTDNSTYFAQSLEIRGIESRLYIQSNLDYSKCQGPQESFRIIGSSNDRKREFSDIFGKARMLSMNVIVLPDFATSTHYGTSANALKKMSSLEVVASSSLMLCRSKNAENKRKSDLY